MNKKLMKLASTGKRLGAYAIDKAIPFFLWIVIVAAAVDMYSFNSYNSYGYGYNNMGGGIGSQIAAVVISSLLLSAYAVVQIVFYVKSQTIGKAILGLQVIDSTNGEPIGVWKMLLREWFAKKASGVIFCIGFLWILIDEKNRGWHDKIMDTYVIDLKESDRLNAQQANRNQEQPANTEEKPVEIEKPNTEDTVVLETIEDIKESAVVLEAVDDIKEDVAIVEATEEVTEEEITE